MIQSLYKTSFDVTKDFAPITLAGVTPNLLVANPGVPFNDVKGLIAYAKANPGKLNYASTGNGTSNHLSSSFFKAMTGTQGHPCPVQGQRACVTDLIAGQVQVMFDNTPNVLPHVKAGKLKALGVSSKTRRSSRRRCRASTKPAFLATTSPCGSASSRLPARRRTS